jgi:hypothetical protein
MFFLLKMQNLAGFSEQLMDEYFLVCVSAFNLGGHSSRIFQKTLVYKVKSYP